MFDGYPVQPPAQKELRRAGKKYILLTGHPPVAEQIAAQVRSSSGMTFGKPNPDGGHARMHRALTPRIPLIDRPAHSIVPTAEAPVEKEPIPPRKGVPARVLDMLNTLYDMDVALPSRRSLRQRFGDNVLKFLDKLQDDGKLRVWYGRNHEGDYQAEMVIRLTGKSRDLRTSGAPDHIRF